MLPTAARKTASVYHLPTASGKQAYPGSADATIDGNLLPMAQQQHVLEGGNYLDPFNFFVELDADLRVGDKVVIDSKNYYVKRVFDASYFGSLRHKRASLSTQL